MGWGRGREQPSHNPHETLERGKGGKGREGKGGKGREGEGRENGDTWEMGKECRKLGKYIGNDEGWKDGRKEGMKERKKEL